MTWEDIKFFGPDEFDSPDAPGSGKHMNLEFVKTLDRLRIQFGAPIIINSGFRTVAHNSKLEGAGKNSAHIRGLAADIKIHSKNHKFRLLKIIFSLGLFNRVGIYDNHIHVDMDDSLPQDVVW